MTHQQQADDASNHRPLALIFLISFVALGLASLWFIYAQFAQVYMKQGQCTVLSAQTSREGVDTDNPESDAALYGVTFHVSLLTADGQRLQVPAYYSSTNYTASSADSAKALTNNFAVGRTFACDYTYLDPSGTKAVFDPAVPLEGFLFPGFFLLASLILSIICFIALRRPPASSQLFSEDAVSIAADHRVGSANL